MKIIVESYNNKYSIEIDHDDITAEEFVEIVRGIMGAMGYHSDTIEEYLG